MQKCTFALQFPTDRFDANKKKTIYIFTFHFYNFSVCVNTSTKRIWTFGFSFFLLPAHTQVHLTDTAVYSSG